MSDRIKLILLYILSFLSCSAPLIVVFAIRCDRYITCLSDAVRLSCGGVICLFFLFLKVIGKLKMPRRVVFYAACLILVYLLDPVIIDLKVLCLAALIGELVDYCIFQNLIRRMQEKIKIKKTANASAAATKDAIDDLFKAYLGGRV